MPKFRIRLKVQGLELEVDGEREDIPAITSAVRRQMTGLIVPAEIMADGHKELGDGSGGDDLEEEGKSKPRAARKRGGARSVGDASGGQAIEFSHDPMKYGNPLQTWSVLDKSIWLLYVVGEITGTKEISGPQIPATFNKYFKTLGRLHPPNVTRDLSRAKGQNPPAVQEEKGAWFLTAEGERQAKELIKGVLNPA